MAKVSEFGGADHGAPFPMSTAALLPASVAAKRDRAP